MHDPHHVICEIKNPFHWRRSTWDGKWQMETSITLWHHDPERGGHDDSCERAWYRDLTEEEERKVRSASKFDWEAIERGSGWFHGSSSTASPHLTGSPRFSRMEILLGVANTVWWQARRKELNYRGVIRVINLGCNLVDNLECGIREAGHSRENHDQLYLCVYRCLKRTYRKWWKNPAFHVHHWHIQWHFGQHLRRWLLSRCEVCGRGFKWGESPCTNHWDPPLARWWQGEAGIHHGGCGAKMTVVPDAPMVAAEEEV